MSVTATPSNTPQSASNPTSALSSEQAIAASNQLRLFRLKNDRQFIEEAVAIPEPVPFKRMMIVYVYTFFIIYILAFAICGSLLIIKFNNHYKSHDKFIKSVCTDSPEGWKELYDNILDGKLCPFGADVRCITEEELDEALKEDPNNPEKSWIESDCVDGIKYSVRNIKEIVGSNAYDFTVLQISSGSVSHLYRTQPC